MNDNLNPHQFQPGTKVYRSEYRGNDESLTDVPDVGRHWSTRPFDFGWGASPGRQQAVVWHGVLEDPASQVHTDYSHGDKRIEGEDEVRLRPGSQVRLTGYTTRKGKFGHVDPTDQPEFALDRTVPIRPRSF